MDARRLKNRSIAMMVVCSLLWSIAGICFKMVPWHAMVLAGSRSLIAAGIIALYMRLKGIPFKWSRQSALAGATLAGTLFCFVSANKMTTAANAIVLQFTAPVFIVLISVIALKIRFRRSDYLVVIFTLLGVSLCFFDRMAAGSLLGNLLAVIAGFFYGAMYVINGEATPVVRMNSVLLGHIFSAVIGLPFAFFTETPVSAGILSVILLLGIVQLGIPYILFALALDGCPPLVCCLISALEPLLNPLWVFLLDGEAPGTFSLLGGVMVIATVTVYNVWNDRQAAARVQ